MPGLDYRILIDLERRFKEAARRVRRKRMVLRKVLVSTSGVPVRHDIGVRPDEFNIVPLSEVQWWFYREPDSVNIYLQASADAEFLVSVAGG